VITLPTPGTGPLSEHVESVRRAIASALDSRIGGPDAHKRWDEVYEAPGDRLISEDSPVRVVHADISMLVGGLRAILAQSLHPRAMAGVAQHSNYRTDPWGRLQRTADFLGVVTFGPKEWALRSIEVVKAVHQRVQGTTSRGEPYSASEPHLLRWVHIAEVDSFLAAHRVYGATRLSSADEDRYVHDIAVVAELLGADRVPRSIAELKAALSEYSPELRSSSDARRAARYLAFPPGLSAPERVGYGPIFTGAAALLPIRSRVMLRIPAFPVTERLVVRPVTGAALALGRWSKPR
jgi:uncharacterized protein (DUF2236 family)